MMKKLLFSALVLTTAMSSCSKNNDQVDPGNTKEIVLSGITGTRVAYDENSAIDGLQFLRADGAVAPSSFAGSEIIRGTRATSGAITFGNRQYYNTTTTTKSFFVSYYPEGQVNSNIVTWNIDGKTDILRTPAITDAGSNQTPVANAALAYQHELAQVEVILSGVAGAGARWGKIKSIKLKSTPSQLLYNYSTLNVTPSSTKSDIALWSTDYESAFAPVDVPSAVSTTKVAAGMFVPSASQTVTLQVEATGAGMTDPRTIVIDLKAGNSFARAQTHVITLNFSNIPTTTEISATSTIERWTVGSVGSGNVN